MAATIASMSGLAWRQLTAERTRTLLCAVAVSFGVAMTLTADYVSSALLATLHNGVNANMEVTHGFLVEQFDQLMRFVALVITGAAAFLTFNTFAMSIHQRQQQLGVLRSLGMTRRQMMRLVLTEGIILGTVSTALGLALGPLLGRLAVAAMNHYGAKYLTFGHGRIAPTTLVWAAGLGLAITLLAVTIPARRATRISPLDALRPVTAVSFSAARPSLTRTGLILIGLLLALLLAAPPGEWAGAPLNLVLTILLAGVWLLGVGLLLPVLIQFTGRAVGFLWGRAHANGRFVGDNIQRAQGRVLLTVVTLAVGLMTITGLTGFMTFAFDDLMGSTMNRIAAADTRAVFPFDLEAGIADLAQVEALLLPPEVITAVTDIVGSRGSLTAFRFALIPELSAFGRSYFTFALDPKTLSATDSIFEFTAGSWETAVPIMTSGCGVLINPLMAANRRLEVGDTFSITTRGGPLTCTVAGVGTGYVNATIIGSNVADRIGATPPIGLTIIPDIQSDVMGLDRDLAAYAADHPGIFVTRMKDFAAVQKEALSIFNVSLNGMLLLAVVAAALGVVNTTLMSVTERRQELALLRAVGASRRQLRHIIIAESALIGLLGGVVGVAAGMGLVVVIVLTYGARSWGVMDLALWPAVGRALRPTVLNGVVALAATPLICAAAVRGVVRRMVAGTAVSPPR